MQLIELCRDLIRIPSLSGNEKEVASFIARTMHTLDFEEVAIDAYGSVVGTIHGKRAGKHLLLDAHIDTVGVENPQLWHYDPFGGVIENGRLYGRGTSDMKGALSAMLVAAHDFGREFAGTLSVSCTVCEECFEGFAARLVAQTVRPDMVIVGEASDLTIKRGQRGRAELVLKTYGTSCHSSNPEKGDNALVSMIRLLPSVFELEEPAHPILGKGIMVPTDIISSPYPGMSVIPDVCTVTFDRRTLVGETEESVLKPIQDLIDTYASIKASVSIAEGSMTTYTGKTITGKRFFPAWLLKKTHPLVAAAIEALPEAELNHYNFCTNASHFAAEAHIPTIGYGPSQENLAHTVDEYIELEQLLGARGGYLRLLNRLLR